MKRLMLFFGLAIGLLLAGCMDDANPYGSGSSGGNQPPPPNTVNLSGTSFTPAQLTVAKGTTVTWNNTDAIVHTATSDSAGSWNTGDIAPNSSKTTTFNTAGTFPYHCTYHRAMGMVGTITVQ